MSSHNLYGSDDIEGGTLAAEAFLSVLMTDARLMTAYDEWRTATCAAVEQAMARQPNVPLSHAIAAAIYRDASGDLERLARFVRDELRLPFSWLPHALRRLFYATATGQGLTLTWPTPGPREAGESYGDYLNRLRREGPAPRKRSDLAVDVVWFYRVRVKHPPDRVTAIAREEHARNPQTNAPSHGRIQAAIKRAERALSGIYDAAPLFEQEAVARLADTMRAARSKRRAARRS
jgi:hypothetical protein